MSSVKKRNETPVSPATQAARSQSRQGVGSQERPSSSKPVNRSITASPAPSGEAVSAARAGSDGRPPIGTGGRRHRRKQLPPPTPVEAAPVTLDPYAAAIQEVNVGIQTPQASGLDDTMNNNINNNDASPNRHLAAGAFMNLDTSGDIFGDLDGEELQQSASTGGNAKAAQEASSVTSRDVSNTNPHFLTTLVVSVVCIFFIVAFAVFIHDLDGPTQHQESNLDDIGLYVRGAVSALLSEYQAAVAVAAVTAFATPRGTVDTVATQNDLAAATLAYATAIDATSQALARAILEHETHFTDANDLNGGVTITKAVDMTQLGRTRDVVMKGGVPALMLARYDAMVGSLLMYEASLFSRNMFRDDGDRLAVAALFELREAQAQFVSASLLTYINSTAVTAGTVRGLQSQGEYNVYWQASGSLTDSESFLRYGASGENVADMTSAAYRSSSSALKYMELPAFATTVLDAGVASAFTASPFTANTSYGVELFASVAAVQTAQDRFVDAAFNNMLFDRNSSHDIVALATVILLFAISVVALIGHVANSIRYGNEKEDHLQDNREIRILNKALARMMTFVYRAAQLDVASTSAVTRKAQRARASIPAEELQLYSALGHLRDLECFLPLSVTKPPLGVPEGALSKYGLFLKPALYHVKGAVAIRMSLSTFHNQFANAGSKQKAVQHHMTRCLSALQEIGDEHVPQSASQLSVQGDHAVLWLNIQKPVTFACMRAISVANAMRDEADRLQIPQPFISVAHGDALVGHVSSQPPTSSAATLPSAAAMASHVTSFTAFGTITRDMVILDNVCRTHEANVSLNNAAVVAYFEERVEYDSDVFNNPGGSSRVNFAELREVSQSDDLPPLAPTGSFGAPQQDGLVEATGAIGNGEESDGNPNPNNATGLMLASPQTSLQPATDEPDVAAAVASLAGTSVSGAFSPTAAATINQKQQQSKSLAQRRNPRPAGAGPSGTSAAPTRVRMSVEDRFRKLHVFFRPLEMVNAATSKVAEETFAILEQHMTLTKDRAALLRQRRGEQGVISNPAADAQLQLEDGAKFVDYSRDLTDGSVMFPCFTIVPMSASRAEDEKLLEAWNRVFDAYVKCCELGTVESISTAMQMVSEFAVKFPHQHHASVERLKKSLLMARNTGTVGLSAASLKRARLLDTLCV